jgi:reverse gyrase
LHKFYPFHAPIVVHSETVKRISATLLFYHQLISFFYSEQQTKTRFLMTQRIALITGGSRGLGKSAALKLAARGTGIILTYNNNVQAAQEVVEEITRKGVKAVALRLNVGDAAGFEVFAQQVKEQLNTVWGRE